MLYKYEMHLHSSACSACAKSTAQELLLAAKANGYAGVVFTNHFYRGNTAVDRRLPWREFTEAYRQDYLAAKQFGKALDLDVLFGIEEVYERGKEVLIYGLSPELIADTPEFRHMDMTEISEFVRKNDGFCVCAHPFRRRGYIPEPITDPDPALFDAIEVNNRGNSDEDNLLAAEFAVRCHKAAFSGGDVHRTEDFGKAGLAFFERVRDNESLVAALRKGAYRLIVNGEYNN